MVLFLRLYIVRPTKATAIVGRFASTGVAFFFLGRGSPPSFLLLGFLAAASYKRFFFSIRAFASGDFFIRSEKVSPFFMFSSCNSEQLGSLKGGIISLALSSFVVFVIEHSVPVPEPPYNNVPYLGTLGCYSVPSSIVPHFSVFTEDS